MGQEHPTSQPCKCPPVALVAASFPQLEAWTLALLASVLASSGCLQGPSTVQAIPYISAFINRYSKGGKVLCPLGAQNSSDKWAGQGLNLGAYLDYAYGGQPAAHSQPPLGVRKHGRKGRVFQGQVAPCSPREGVGLIRISDWQLLLGLTLDKLGCWVPPCPGPGPDCHILLLGCQSANCLVNTSLCLNNRQLGPGKKDF